MKRFKVTCLIGNSTNPPTQSNKKSNSSFLSRWPFYITLCVDESGRSTGAYGIFYDTGARGVLDFGSEISAFRGSFRKVCEVMWLWVWVRMACCDDMLCLQSVVFFRSAEFACCCVAGRVRGRRLGHLHHACAEHQGRGRPLHLAHGPPGHAAEVCGERWLSIFPTEFLQQ